MLVQYNRGFYSLVFMSLWALIILVKIKLIDIIPEISAKVLIERNPAFHEQMLATKRYL